MQFALDGTNAIQDVIHIAQRSEILNSIGAIGGELDIGMLNRTHLVLRVATVYCCPKPYTLLASANSFECAELVAGERGVCRD